MIESFKKNKQGIILMICSSICACIGQLFWKLSSTNGALLIFSGFIFYGLGALIMIIAYKFGKLSVLQPILSLNYVLSLVFGFIFLHESVTVLKIIGVLVIMCGVIFIAGGDNE